MKTKKKLSLNRATVTNLNGINTAQVQGGSGDVCIQFTGCVCPSGESAGIICVQDTNDCNIRTAGCDFESIDFCREFVTANGNGCYEDKTETCFDC